LPADDCRDYKPKNSLIKVTRNDTAVPPDSNNNDLTGRASSSTSPTPSSFPFKHLAPLESPVPSDWLTIEENFILFLVVYLPLISRDFLGSGESTFNDGSMHVMYIKEGASRIDILKILTEAEDGSHLKNDLVEFVKVKAFRLEPLADATTETTGTFMVDGELIPYGPVQAEITPSLGNVLANLKE
jgi:sphingosine kinase